MRGGRHYLGDGHCRPPDLEKNILLGQVDDNTRFMHDVNKVAGKGTLGK